MRAARKIVLGLLVVGGPGSPPIVPLAAVAIEWVSGTADATPLVEITFPDITSSGTIVHYEFADNALFTGSTVIDHTITEAEEGSLQISPEMEPLTNGDWWLRVWYTVDGQEFYFSNVETKTIEAIALPVVTHRGFNIDNGTTTNNSFNVDIGDAAADRVVLVAVAHQGNGSAWVDVRPTSVTANGVTLVRVAEAPDYIVEHTGYAAWYMGIVADGGGLRNVTVGWPGSVRYLSRIARVFTATGLSDTSAPQESGGFNTLGGGGVVAGSANIPVVENDILLITGCVFTGGSDPAYTGATEAVDATYLDVDGPFKLFAARWAIDTDNESFFVGTIAGAGVAMVTLR